MNKIMLLEDDLSLIDGLSYALNKQGWNVTVAKTVTEAIRLWRGAAFDLLILDVSLPDGNGFDFCKNVRQVSDVPILFLTASDEETNVVMGLDIGGDDYVTKPFKLGVLISRINALLRRGRGTLGADDSLDSNGITLSLMQGQAFKNHQNLELTSVEYRLLCYFMRNPNRILTKEQIYGQLWDCDDNFVDDNTLSVYIRRLRLKIEDNPERPRKIITVRRMGYKWSVDV
ncbi:MAG: response regulator transcription factor [Oscillibacter sp.]|nr:response regulator transcription factor [Oscillibacter sp.]